MNTAKKIIGFLAIGLMALSPQAYAFTTYSGSTQNTSSSSYATSSSTDTSDSTKSGSSYKSNTSFNVGYSIPTIEVLNYTKNPNCNTTACWGTSVSVASDEIVSVKIQFKNTGTADANNTTLKMTVPSGSGSSASVSGGVGASNANYVSGTGTIYKSSGQTFSYAGVANFFANRTAIANNVPTRQLSVSEVSQLLNSGYNIGTVSPGSENQGALVVRFKVSSSAVSGAPSVNTLSATNVTKTSATLNGNFNSNGASTATQFAWSIDQNKTGLNNQVDKLTPQTAQSAASGSFQANISNLAPDTTYYFRAMAQNKNGKTFSTVVSFKTLADIVRNTQCGDGIDNDSDGYIDINDPACNGSVNGSTEFPYNNPPTVPQCRDGIDNDNDGYTDLQDPACNGNSNGTTEFPYNPQPVTPQCRDGIDNDGDGYTDLSDPACNGNSNGVTESPFNAPPTIPQCRDGYDNDGDGYTDLADPACNGNSNGTTESPYNYNPPVVTQCNNGYDDDGDGLTDLSDPACAGNPYGSTEYPYNNQYIQQCRDGIDNDGDGYTDLQDPACNGNSYGSTEYPDNRVVVQGTVNVATLVATSVFQTSSQLNGVVTSSGIGNSQAYFEWGTTTSLGNKTVDQYVASGEIRIFDTITGLNPDTIYYYRVVGKKGSSMSFGEIRVFRTANTGTTNPPVVIVRGTTTNTTVSSGSLIALNVETTFKTVKINDIVTYTVTYKNISKNDIDGVVVRVVLPKELGFQKATAGEFSDSENTLTVALGTVKAGAEGKIMVETKVIRKPKTSNLIVVTGIAAYKNPLLLAQDEAIAYELINIADEKNGSSLGALSLFGSDSFLPNTLLGWLLLILVLFALVYIGRRMYVANQEKSKPTPTA